MIKILITGGAGYVGSILTPHLINKGHKITVIHLKIYGKNVLWGETKSFTKKCTENSSMEQNSQKKTLGR